MRATEVPVEIGRPDLRLQAVQPGHLVYCAATDARERRCGMKRATEQIPDVSREASMRNRRQRGLAAANAREAVVSAAVSEIERRSDEALGPPDLACRLGVSRRQLDRLFLSTHGKSVHQFIRWRRLHIAAERIAVGWKVEAAALESGFRSRSHFYGAFRQEFGTTPASIRPLDHQPVASNCLACARVAGRERSRPEALLRHRRCSGHRKHRYVYAQRGDPLGRGVQPT